MKLQNFYIEGPKKNSKFVAFYADGSGAALFYRCKNGNYYSTHSELLPPDNYWFCDAGFALYAYLPKKSQLWCAATLKEVLHDTHR